MSNIGKAFENGKAFIPFITCGYPDLETTGKVVRAAVENGADLIELGIPVSDPTAEGPVIQEADLCALKGGITTDAVFEFVRGLRKDVSIPLVFMTYANVIFSYGAEKFMSACREIGIDALFPGFDLWFVVRGGADVIGLLRCRLGRVAVVLPTLGAPGEGREQQRDLPLAAYEGKHGKNRAGQDRDAAPQSRIAMFHCCLSLLSFFFFRKTKKEAPYQHFFYETSDMVPLCIVPDVTPAGFPGLRI